MSRSNSPAARNRAPKPNTDDAPAALRRRGIFSATEIIPAGARLRCSSPLWVFYGDQLCRRYLRQPGEEK